MAGLSSSQELQKVPNVFSFLFCSGTKQFKIGMASTDQSRPNGHTTNMSVDAVQDSRAALLPSTPSTSPKIESEAINYAPEDTPSPGLLSTWWFELASCVSMLLALAAIIITLAVFDGHPSPSWPYSITVNSLVAVFLVVLKTCLLFPLNEGESLMDQRSNSDTILTLILGISQLKWLWYKKTPRPLAHLALFDDASRGPLGAFKLLYTQKGA